MPPSTGDGICKEACKYRRLVLFETAIANALQATLRDCLLDTEMIAGMI
jgi:hypothetical protein